jgi:predicted PurR-regulated permease PerM
MCQTEESSSAFRIARNTTIVASIVAAFVIGISLLWLASTAIIAFGVGIVLAVVIDAGARGLRQIVPWPRPLRLLIVVLVGVLLVAAGLWWSGTTLVNQLNGFVAALKSLFGQAQELAKGSDIFPGNRGLFSMLPNPATILGGATSVLPQAFSGFSIGIAILFIAPFLALEPEIYKSIVLSLIAKEKRDRVSDVLDDAAMAMRRWLFGQSISMAVIFVFSLSALVAIGMPYAVLLAVQAGLLTFIPTLGPFIAGVVILLAGLSQSPTMALYGLLTYLAIQFLESNLITPVVQERTVKLPPAATLFLQLVAGLLFGLLGLAFVVPLAAAGKQIISELYVDDYLGGGWTVQRKAKRSWLSHLIDRLLGASGEKKSGKKKNKRGEGSETPEP